MEVTHPQSDEKPAYICGCGKRGADEIRRFVVGPARRRWLETNDEWMDDQSGLTRTIGPAPSARAPDAPSQESAGSSRRCHAGGTTRTCLPVPAASGV